MAFFPHLSFLHFDDWRVRTLHEKVIRM
jgi:hypothetical protein